MTTAKRCLVFLVMTAYAKWGIAMIKTGITMILTMLVIAGCSDQFPPPEDAMIACIESGGNPIYISDTNRTIFSCDEKHEAVITQYK